MNQDDMGDVTGEPTEEGQAEGVETPAMAVDAAAEPPAEENEPKTLE